jgi:hypothetical protein
MIVKYKPDFVVMLRHEASLNRIEATFYLVVLQESSKGDFVQ